MFDGAGASDAFESVAAAKAMQLNETGSSRVEANFETHDKV